jgi:hypothetical protein
MKTWALLVLGLGGCGTSAALPASDDARPSVTVDAALDAGAMDAALLVWSSAATGFVAERGWGYGPPPPAQCSYSDRYTFTTADRQLTWSRCWFDGAGGATLGQGHRILTDSEWQSVLSALEQVVLTVHPNACGADKSEESLVVSTPAGETKYLDFFYACQKRGTYVDELDGVFTALEPLAR